MSAQENNLQPGDMVELNPNLPEDVRRNILLEIGHPPYEMISQNGGFIFVKPNPGGTYSWADCVQSVTSNFQRHNPSLLKLGQTCHVCGHKYVIRTMFFSVDTKPSCWCD